MVDIGHQVSVSLRSEKMADILICNMLTCFKDYKYVFTFPILDFVQQKKTKFAMEQPYILPIIYCQYLACWCPGDLRSQGISRHGTDQISQNISYLASEGLKM